MQYLDIRKLEQSGRADVAETQLQRTASAKLCLEENDEALSCGSGGESDSCSTSAATAPTVLQLEPQARWTAATAGTEEMAKALIGILCEKDASQHDPPLHAATTAINGSGMQRRQLQVAHQQLYQLMVNEAQQQCVEETSAALSAMQQQQDPSSQPVGKVEPGQTTWAAAATATATMEAPEAPKELQEIPVEAFIADSQDSWHGSMQDHMDGADLGVLLMQAHTTRKLQHAATAKQWNKLQLQHYSAEHLSAKCQPAALPSPPAAAAPGSSHGAAAQHWESTTATGCTAWLDRRQSSSAGSKTDPFMQQAAAAAALAAAAETAVAMAAAAVQTGSLDGSKLNEMVDALLEVDILCSLAPSPALLTPPADVTHGPALPTPRQDVPAQLSSQQQLLTGVATSTRGLNQLRHERQQRIKAKIFKLQSCVAATGRLWPSGAAAHQTYAGQASSSAAAFGLNFGLSCRTEDCPSFSDWLKQQQQFGAECGSFSDWLKQQLPQQHQQKHGSQPGCSSSPVEFTSFPAVQNHGGVDMQSTDILVEMQQQQQQQHHSRQQLLLARLAAAAAKCQFVAAAAASLAQQLAGKQYNRESSAGSADSDSSLQMCSLAVRPSTPSKTLDASNINSMDMSSEQPSLTIRPEVSLQGQAAATSLTIRPAQAAATSLTIRPPQTAATSLTIRPPQAAATSLTIRPPQNDPGAAVQPASSSPTGIGLALEVQGLALGSSCTMAAGSLQPNRSPKKRSTSPCTHDDSFNSRPMCRSRSRV